MRKHFQEFLSRGHIVELAAGIVLGLAFGRIIASLVRDVLTPPLGLLLGGTDLSNLFIDLSGQAHATLIAARQDGAATLNYGLFLSTIFDFLIVAACIFLLLRQVHRLTAPGLPEVSNSPGHATMPCPFCLTVIPAGAKRCGHCTSSLQIGSPIY
jgi:large conductance mechanosensitive channel